MILTYTKKDKFLELRTVLVREKARLRKETDNGTKPKQDSFDKYQRRRDRAKLFNDDKRFQEFFNWFHAIRIQSKLDDREFGKLIGVSRHMVKQFKLWQTSGGYFPSDFAIKRVIELEGQLRARIRRSKRKYRIRHGNRVYTLFRKELKELDSNNSNG